MQASSAGGRQGAAAATVLSLTVLVALLALLAWTLFGGREPVPQDGVGTGEQACQGCTIELQPLFTIGVNEMTNPLAGAPIAVVRGPRGQRMVFQSGGLPSLFDPDGRWVHEIGRSGQGPGEYQYPVHGAFLPGDSILILDVGQLRATVLNAALSPIRTIALPVRARSAAVLSWPSGVAVVGTSYTAEHADLAVHVLDMFGESAIHVHGIPDGGQVAVAGALPLPRVLAPVADGDSSFWVAHMVEYRLNHLSADGQLLGSVHRTPEWFAEAAPSVHRGNPSLAPPPMLTALAVRGDTLWVAFDIARPDWRRAWSEIVIPPSGELRTGEGPEITELVMGRIQAIDLTSGDVLASRDVDGIIVGLDREAQAVVYDLDGNLLPRLRVFGVRVADQ